MFYLKNFGKNHYETRLLIYSMSKLAFNSIFIKIFNLS